MALSPFEKAVLAELKALRKELHGIKKSLTVEDRQNVETSQEEPEGYIAGIKVKPRPK